MRLIHQILKPGGQALILVQTPYALLYSGTRDMAEKLRKNNLKWPGEILNVKRTQDLLDPQEKMFTKKQMSNIPNTMHGVFPEDMESTAKNAGFTIKYINLAGLWEDQMPPKELTYPLRETCVKEGLDSPKCESIQGVLSAPLKSMLQLDHQNYIMESYKKLSVSELNSLPPEIATKILIDPETKEKITPEAFVNLPTQQLRSLAIIGIIVQKP
jgi:hypothetical protein